MRFRRTLKMHELSGVHGLTCAGAYSSEDVAAESLADDIQMQLLLCIDPFVPSFGRSGRDHTDSKMDMNLKLRQLRRHEKGVLRMPLVS